MKIIVSSTNINQNISKVVGIFKRLNYLDSFWTTIFFPFKTKWLQNRYYEEIRFKFVKLIFFKEIMRRICVSLNLQKLFSQDNSIFSSDSVSKNLDYLVIGDCVLDKLKQNPKLKKDYTKEFELD